MLATLTMLAFAHVLADFVLQSRAMVARKHRRAVLLRHTAIVGATAFVALAAWTPGALIAVAVVTLAHAGIDAAKLALARRARHPFAALRLFGADQCAHLLSIGIVAALLPQAYAEGLWPAVLGSTAAQGLAAAAALVTGVIAATRVGDLMLAQLLAGIRHSRSAGSPGSAAGRAEDAGGADELRAGAWIGWLERGLVFLFVLLGEFNAIGFVIAAKSILRFEYARDPAKSELVIIGTLASFGWAVLTALATAAALDGLWPVGVG